MALRKMAIPPNQESYSVAKGSSVVATKLEGGAARYRQYIAGASSNVTVSWTTDRSGYKYLQSFFNTATVNGSEPFTIDLYMDEPLLTEHKAYFIPGSFGLEGQKGLAFSVSAELEATPIPPDTAYDESFMTMYETYGQESGIILNLFEQLANVDLPEALQ